MIKVNKDYLTPPEVLTRQGCEDKIKLAVINQSGSDKIFNGNHYKHEQVTKELNNLYNKKCAYCESFSEHVATLQVEHYRPKAALTFKTHTSSGQEKIQVDSSHNGYYWLGCEWSNLLLSCSKCNGKDAKGNLFPILGIRITHENPFVSGSFDRTRLIADKSPLINERPLLLNPEIDNPKDHLSFRYLGLLEGLTQNGVISIDTYKLNRDALYKRRQKIVNDFVIELKAILLKANNGDYTSSGYKNTLKEFFSKVEYVDIETHEYVFWRQHIFIFFSECILSRVETSFRLNIGKAYILYKQGNL